MNKLVMALVLAGAAFVPGLVTAQTSPDNALSSHFQRGDTNDDGSINIADAVTILGVLFPSGCTPGVDCPLFSCDDAADVNNDEAVNIADAVALLSFLFSGGVAPAIPFNFIDADPPQGFFGTNDPVDGLGCRPAHRDDMTGDIDPAYIVGGGTGLVTVDTTLTRDRTWILEGTTFVQAGVTLTIEAGVTIIGINVGAGMAVNPAALVTRRGDIVGAGSPSARLVCNGTAVDPVIFTSPNGVGSRARQDWGGVVVLGRGDNNIDYNSMTMTSGGSALVEGLQNDPLNFWGGGVGNPFPTDDCGSISYTRIEYAGFILGNANELNSITLAGAGSDTTLDHVMCKLNVDDGFEWFGGAASLKYGLCYGIADDSFDYSFGYNGKGQYWVCQQTDDAGDRGFEVDGNENVFGNLPLTNPLISNVTLIGGAASDAGIVLRRGTGSRIYNGLVQGWNDAGLDLDDAETFDQSPLLGNLIVNNCAFALNNEDAETGDTDGAYTTLEFLLGSVAATAANDSNLTDATAMMPGNSSATSLIVGTFDFTDPVQPVIGDLRGDATVVGLPAAATAPFMGDAFFDTPTFIGAVDPNVPATSAWTNELWISYLTR